MRSFAFGALAPVLLEDGPELLERAGADVGQELSLGLHFALKPLRALWTFRPIYHSVKPPQSFAHETESTNASRGGS